MQIDLIINRIRMDMVHKGDMMSIDDVMDILSVSVIGTVPEDEDIVISTNQGEPLVGMNGCAGQAYLNICKRILGESVPFVNLDNSRHLWSKITCLLKRA
ncbi:MAG: septum site-determining protein MinD, partial [Clostridium sp.]